MTASAMDYPDQIDCVWLAVDPAGRLGAMITAGLGPIPGNLLTGGIEVTDTEHLLLGLPVVADAQPIEDARSFLELSRRGLFVYDWSDVHRSDAAASHAYELVCSPSVHLPMDDLAPELQKLASRIDATIGSPLVDVRSIANGVIATPKP